MIDVYAPDLIDTLNRRASTEFDALVSDLKDLAEKRPGEFILLLFEAMPDDDGAGRPVARPRHKERRARR